MYAVGFTWKRAPILKNDEKSGGTDVTRWVCRNACRYKLIGVDEMLRSACGRIVNHGKKSRVVHASKTSERCKLQEFDLEFFFVFHYYFFSGRFFCHVYLLLSRRSDWRVKTAKLVASGIYYAQNATSIQSYT